MILLLILFNSLSKYLIMGGIFGYMGYKLPGWETELYEKVNEKRAERGWLPIQRYHYIYNGASKPEEYNTEDLETPHYPNGPKSN